MTLLQTPDVNASNQPHQGSTALDRNASVTGASVDLSRVLTFDRARCTLSNAGWREKMAGQALRGGARLSARWGYRGFAAASKVLRGMLPEREIVVRLNTDTLFAFPFCDGYWSLLLNPDYRYERDIERFFRGIADADYTLIDCGANFGYWSSLVTGEPFGAQQALAIEPSSVNYGWLRRNAAFNGGRFQCLQRAIGAEQGVARLSGRKHEALSIAGDAGASGEDVAVMPLDDLFSGGQVSPSGSYVIKLDVEGVEIAALQGATQLLKSDCVVICEEHGNDRHHTMSRYLIEQTALKVFCFDPQTGRFEHLETVSPLDRIKVFANFGYNVLATASPMWEARIRALRA